MSCGLLYSRGLTAIHKGFLVGGRTFSASAARPGNLEIRVDPAGYTVLSMNKGPANSLNLEFLQEIHQAVKQAESETKGIILTSSLPTIYSAGLEITELYKPDPERLRVFWAAVQEIFLTLYCCRVPTVAAINGHSPAGGCLLALTCDYRVMVGPKYSIGLNETKLGIVAPFWFKDAMVPAIGLRQAELALTLGTLFSTQQALSIGLVDKMVADKQEAVQEATKMLTEFMNIPSEARHQSKLMMRQEAYNRLAEHREEDIDRFTTNILKPAMQVPLGKYLEALKNRKKK